MESSTSKEIKAILLGRLSDRLIYSEKQHINQGLSSEYVDAKLAKLNLKAIYLWLWMAVVFVSVCGFIVTWGMKYGWENIWSYVLSGAYLGIAGMVVSQYVDLQKEIATWEVVLVMLKKEDHGEVYENGLF